MSSSNILERSNYSCINLYKTISLITASILALFLSGCDSSSSDDQNESGYLQFINGSKNSPTIWVTYTNEDEEEIVDTIAFGYASRLRNLTSGEYQMVVSWQETEEDFNDVFEQDIQLFDNKVDIILLTGEFSQPELVFFEFDYDVESLSDDDDEDQFSLQVINANQDSAGVDVYLSRDDETFNEAQLLASAVYKQISDPVLFDVEDYKLYLTQTGSSEVIYESNIIEINSNYQYLLLLREESGPSESDFTVDLINNVSTINFSDKESKTELRLYNAIVEHELLPEFTGVIDIDVDGVAEDEVIEDLAQGTMSETLVLSASDYAMDIIPDGADLPIAENHFVSLNPNDDKTVFLYLTEETEEVDDEADETSVYINSLIVDNSNRVSLYDHEIKIINLVQNEDFDSISTYFVKSNETVDTADYSTTAFRAVPRSITLPNNTYDVSLIVTVNSSDLLLDFQTITLEADSGDRYLIIEEDEMSSSGYSMTLLEQ